MEDSRPGFREDFKCPSCLGNDYGYVYRHNLNVLYCYDCHTAWTVHRKIEDIYDEEERI